MLKRIAIIGPESTGKSELAQQLAREYETEWVPEYARFYLDRLDRPYQQSDLLDIAHGQIAWEEQKAEYAKNYMFCDTNLVVIKVWSDHKYGNTDPFIEQEINRMKYDFYLLTAIDIPWRDDPQREHPQLREHFFNVYQSYLESHQLPFAIIRGIEENRTQCAMDAIEFFFKEN